MLRLVGLVAVTVAYALSTSRSNNVYPNVVPLTELMNDGEIDRPVQESQTLFSATEIDSTRNDAAFNFVIREQVSTGCGASSTAISTARPNESQPRTPEEHDQLQ